MEEQYNRIVNMTNKETADILKNLVTHSIVARANGKSMRDCAIHVALTKAIMLLDTTPDKKENKTTCRLKS